MSLTSVVALALTESLVEALTQGDVRLVLRAIQELLQLELADGLLLRHSLLLGGWGLLLDLTTATTGAAKQAVCNSMALESSDERLESCISDYTGSALTPLKIALPTLPSFINIHLLCF